MLFDVHRTVGEPAEGPSDDLRVGDRELGHAVEGHLVVAGIGSLQGFLEQAEPLPIGRGALPPQALADRPDLQDHQGAGHVEGPGVEDEVGRLVHHPAELAGVDPEVRHQAVLERDRGVHVRGQSALAGPPDRRVGGVHGDRRMAREGGTHAQAVVDRSEDPLDHLVRCIHAVLAGAITVVERGGAGLEVPDPRRHRRIGHQVEETIGTGHHATGLGRHVAADVVAQADDAQHATFAFISVSISAPSSDPISDRARSRRSAASRSTSASWAGGTYSVAATDTSTPSGGSRS